MQQYTAVIKEEDQWWFGWVEEIPGVNCQEKTKSKLLESLKTTLQEAIQMNKEEALSAASGDYIEEPIAV